MQALGLCTGRMAHTGSRGIALIFLDHSNIQFVITHVPSWLHYQLYLCCTVNSSLYNSGRVFQFKQLVFKYVTALSLTKYLLKYCKVFCVWACDDLIER